MPSAAPISGVGFVRVETVSFGGTVKERVMATLRGVNCSGVPGVIGGEVDMVGTRVLYMSTCGCARDTTTKG